MNVLLVALGGAIGASGRYLIGGWVQARTGPDFPWGTFLVNISGALLIGIVLGMFERSALSGQARLFLAVGVLGGYTTFSSFAYENLQLAEANQFGLVLLNVAGQVVLGLLAAYFGVVVARALWGA